MIAFGSLIVAIIAVTNEKKK
ncbi:putative holin-like toxin [Rossellomorea marisflavi]|nr:putative holin-like toxin [Rossellomorea marisflavi]USK94517.1 putative holin-like toxin [Rossellomorea marisflavi]UTE74975.1 putative holin-like toxin [Rossellomorea marisflavi]WJV21047.1 putative holin-like toxin [Rossellomorea marisflavi]